MLVKDLISILEGYDPEMPLDYTCSDKDDNFEGQLYVNSYNGRLELDMVVDPTFMIIIDEDE